MQTNEIPVVHLADLVRGKTVAVVGNAEPETDCSAEIDACDVVIRVNHFYNMPSGKVGKKVDILVVTPCTCWNKLSDDEKGLAVLSAQKPLVMAVKFGDRMGAPETQTFFGKCGCEIVRDEPTAPSVARFTTGTVVLAKLAEFAENCEVKAFGFSASDEFREYLKKDGPHYLAGAASEVCARDLYFVALSRKCRREEEAQIVIPARKGSSLKDKNLREWGGSKRSLLALAIDKALTASGNVPPVVLTDSDVYSDVANCAGASVPYLDPTTADDENVAVKLRRWRDVSGFRGWVAVMQCTSPALSTNTVKKFLDAARCSACPGEAWISVAPDKRKTSSFFVAEGKRTLRQLDPSVDPSVPRQALGQTMWFFGGVAMVHTDALDAPALFEGAQFVGVECDSREAVDIDDAFDFEREIE